MRILLFSLITTTVVVLILVLFMAFSIPRQTTPPSTQVNIPTPFPTNHTNNATPRVIPQVKYDEEKANTLINSSKNRQVLSTAGTGAKEKIITSLGNNSGIVYTSTNVNIEYIKSPDLFQGMIKTADITGAKKEAVSWFVQQGLSQDDICRLPLSFYLSSQVSSQLKNSGILFNPLPDGC